MITLVIKTPFEKALKIIKKTAPFIDAFEYRVDLMENLSVCELKELFKASAKPSIITLRMKSQGGAFRGDFCEKWKQIQDYLALEPSYIDLEVGTPIEFIKEIRAHHPRIKIIYSFHDINKTPKDLFRIVTLMKQVEVDELKIAVFANKLSDVAKIFNLSILLKTEKRKYTLISLGNKGQITRSLAGYLGSSFWYCKDIEDSEDVLGQYHYRDLTEVYQIRSQSKKTKLFALIGTPVFQSPSHLTHNFIFKKMSLDAVYVKIEVFLDEIDWFFKSRFKNFFSGFSITAPYKEVAFSSFSNQSNQERQIGAVNTLVKKENRWIAKNTDACGVGDAIESHISLKRKICAIIGAGGSAKATIFELLKRGATPLIFNRTKEKGEVLSKKFKIKFYPLDKFKEFKEEIDLLINTTSVGMPPLFDLPIPSSALPKGKYVMDLILFPKETPLLYLAKQHENKIIYGIEMFYKQAIEQFKNWFENIDENKILLAFSEAEEIYDKSEKAPR